MVVVLDDLEFLETEIMTEDLQVEQVLPGTDTSEDGDGNIGVAAIAIIAAACAAVILGVVFVYMYCRRRTEKGSEAAPSKNASEGK